jgi:hypothetical protein
MDMQFFDDAMKAIGLNPVYIGFEKKKPRCEECERSYGPHFTGKCEHSGQQKNKTVKRQHVKTAKKKNEIKRS